VGTRAIHHLHLDAHGEASLRWAIACEIEHGAEAVGGRRPLAAHATGIRPDSTLVPTYEAAAERATRELLQARSREPVIESSNAQFNRWIERSLVDLHLLRTDTPFGAYPYAGVPWYSTVFGRDGIITALQCLWLNPDLAR